MITDYATLKAAIANWLARADLTSAIPEFIQLAEGRINRTLFIRDRMTEVSGVSEDGAIPLPSDFDRMIALRVAHGAGLRAIHPVSPDRNPRLPGSPVGYSLTGSTIRLVGTTDTNYTLTYYARVPALSESNTQNWLLAKEPSLYLYGALIEAAPYLRNDERASMWAQQFRAVLDDLSMTDEKARFGNTPAQMVDFNAP